MTYPCPQLTTRNSFTWAAYVLIFVALTTGCRWGAIGQNAVGVRLHQQGRYAEALQQFEAAKIADPTNPDSFYNLASTYHRMGVSQKDPKIIEQAESLYHQCLDMSPNHAACYRGLGVLLVESNRSDKAFTLLKKWVADNPQSSDAKIELAKLHQEFNQTAIASQMLDEVLAKDPNNAVAWSARGHIREANGELSQARQNYIQSLSLNAVQPEVAQRLASVDLRLGQQAWQNTVATTQNSMQGTLTAAQNALNTTQNGLNATQNTIQATQAAIASSGGAGTPTPPAAASLPPTPAQTPLQSPRF
jgi:Flp pilus assembly protein TadD